MIFLTEQHTSSRLVIPLKFFKPNSSRLSSNLRIKCGTERGHGLTLTRHLASPVPTPGALTSSSYLLCIPGLFENQLYTLQEPLDENPEWTVKIYYHL